MEQISELYDGKLEIFKTEEFSENGRKQYLEVSLAHSQTLSNYDKHKYLPASKIALLVNRFYSKQVKQKYDAVRVSLNYDSGMKQFEFLREKLDEVGEVEIEIDSVLSTIKAKEYNNLHSLIAVSPPFNFDHDKNIEGMKSADENRGEIINYITTGFTYNTLNNGSTFVKIFGVMRRKITDNVFCVYVNTVDKKVIFIEYKW